MEQKVFQGGIARRQSANRYGRNELEERRDKCLNAAYQAFGSLRHHDE